VTTLFLLSRNSEFVANKHTKNISQLCSLVKTYFADFCKKGKEIRQGEIFEQAKYADAVMTLETETAINTETAKQIEDFANANSMTTQTAEQTLTEQALRHKENLPTRSERQKELLAEFAKKHGWARFYSAIMLTASTILRKCKLIKSS
jgi:hypothetical protein